MRLERAKAGWNYLWNLLENEVKNQNISKEILMVLYRYQVELDTDRHLLELYEIKLKNIDPSEEDKETISDGLSRYVSKFQAIALTIENLLRE
ncbi:MAG: hypothetical protein HYY52_05465 [Candidatus Melainabacteria bacterium]|nr:hypothetical protein [Candidatus Melainabacteria bacterium]